MSEMLLALLVPALVALAACVLFLVRRQWRSAIIAALVCANMLTLAGWLVTSHSRVQICARLNAEENKVQSLEARVEELGNTGDLEPR